VAQGGVDLISFFEEWLEFDDYELIIFSFLIFI
jgi:hypothetical protein